MRFTSRPVSSPGRTDNPPLLMRFLRTNVGSRSRGRSRSRKPIFFRRKHTAETQEPSSPKVTCMGQVRIRRSKKPKPGTNRVAGSEPERHRRPRRCGWVKNAFSCNTFAGKIKPTWRKWKSFSHVSFSRKSEKRSSSSRSEPIFGRSTVEPEEEIKREDRREEEEDKDLTATPPRNALFLTRCRSAPYRSPSFADNLFQEDEVEEEIKENPFRRQASPEKVSVSGELSSETEEEGDKGRTESVVSEEAKRCVLEAKRCVLEAKRCVLGSPRGGQCRVLTRCNSEPSRLVPDMGYRQNQRLGFT